MWFRIAGFFGGWLVVSLGLGVAVGKCIALGSRPLANENEPDLAQSLLKLGSATGESAFGNLRPNVGSPVPDRSVAQESAPAQAETHTRSL